VEIRLLHNREESKEVYFVFQYLLDNLQQLLNSLCKSRKCRRQIFERSGELRPSVVILKNGRQIQSLDGVQTSLEAGDTIAMFPPLGGG